MWHFRNSFNEAQQSWERLCAELGIKIFDGTMIQPQLVALTLGKPASDAQRVVLVLIGSRTYRVQQITRTELALIQW